MVEEELGKYLERTKKSKAFFERAKKAVPLGADSNFRTWDPYPVYFTKGRGSKIWGLDGEEYVDFMMAFGVLLTGHSHPTLVSEMKRLIEEGTLFGLPYERALYLSEELQRRFSMDKFRLGVSGTDVTMHAIRLARAFTEREKIVKMEGCYHGAHDSVLVSIKPSLRKVGDPKSPNQVPASAGLLEAVRQSTLVAPFNDIEAMEDLFRKNEDEIAAVIAEPVPMNMGVVLPRDGYLKDLRRLTEEHNALLIFDEVKTGAKIAPGGAVERFKVNPDLITLAKAIGGGYPIAAFGGKDEVMELLAQRKCAHMGTYNANPLAVNASLITLTKILKDGAYAPVFNLENGLARGYEDILEDQGVVGRVQHIGPNGCVLFTDKEVNNYRDFLTHDIEKFDHYLIAMLNRGIIPEGVQYDEQWTLSVQHTKEDVDKHLEAFKEVAPLLKH